MLTILSCPKLPRLVLKNEFVNQIQKERKSGKIKIVNEI
jgi:hypothetical protein